MSRPQGYSIPGSSAQSRPVQSVTTRAPILAVSDHHSWVRSPPAAGSQGGGPPAAPEALLAAAAPRRPARWLPPPRGRSGTGGRAPSGASARPCRRRGSLGASQAPAAASASGQVAGRRRGMAGGPLLQGEPSGGGVGGSPAGAAGGVPGARCGELLESVEPDGSPLFRRPRTSRARRAVSVVMRLYWQGCFQGNLSGAPVRAQVWLKGEFGKTREAGTSCHVTPVRHEVAGSAGVRGKR